MIRKETLFLSATVSMRQFGLLTGGGSRVILRVAHRGGIEWVIEK
jgi:hypothetical protein